MATFSKIILSGSTNGQGIPVTATTASQGSLLHTAVTGSAGSVDEVYVYVHSTVTTIATIKFAYGPTTATGSRFSYTVTADDLSGLHLAFPGLVMNGAIALKAYATTANIINCFGFVNRLAS